jgi:hypothetical protein
MVVVYVLSSVVIVFLLHQLYEYFKNTLTVRKNTNLSELYAKKYQSFIDRSFAPPNHPAERADAATRIDKTAVSDDLSQFVSEFAAYALPEDIQCELI